MKCTSCVSSRTKSDDDDEEDEAAEIATSPARTMDKIEEEYRVESPPTIPEQPSTSRGLPSVSIIEVPPDYRGESSRVYDIALDKQHSPSPSSSSHLLRPLDVITEETSDISDSENRPVPLKPDLCFPRPKARFKKAKSRNLLKSLLQPKQEQTTCVLVDAKIAESAPEEYRSFCTTEVVPEEILEVEVIDLGSNSSSLADLTEIDDLEENPTEVDPFPGDVIEPERDQDKINNNGTISDGVFRGDDANEFRNTASDPPNRDDNDNEIDLESSATAAELAAEREEEQLYSEEDNNRYDHNVDADADQRESATSEIFTQTHAATQNDGAGDDSDDDDDDGEFHENDRTESDRDCEDDRAIASLSADVDRAGVVTQQLRNVIEVKECTEDEPIDCDCVTHRKSSSGSSSGEDRHPVEVIDDSGAVDPKTIKMTEESEQVPKPPPPIPLPPQPAALAAPTRTVAPSRPPPPPPSPSPPTDEVTNLGQDDISGGSASTVAARENAQIHSGSDTGETDSANADQNSAQDSVDAVVEETATDGESDSSVLLKFLQDSQPPPENRPTFGDEKPQQNLPAVKTKIERTVKNGQLNYEIVQDHRVLREETVTTATAATHTSTGEVILRRHQGSRQPPESHLKEPSPEQKAALVHDLRNEISRIKDAELQEEFRKLELEAARFEEELDKISTIMPTSSVPPPHPENLTYYVSKQNDFAVERPPPPRSKPPPPVAPSTAPKPSPTSVAKSSSNDQLYNEWQQKMEEREARRLHKVIQLSKTPNDPTLSQPIPLPAPPQTPPGDPPIEDEFLRKVKDRRRKFTFPAAGGSEDSDCVSNTTSSAPATPVAGRKPVPKHIEAEFAQFAEIRKQQQQEQKEVKATERNSGESPAGDGTIAQRPSGLLVLASAIGIVVWSVCRVLFGRK